MIDSSSTVVADNLDPFSSDSFTRLIHLSSSLSAMEKAAMLSRYSRSRKSLIDLIETEFKNKERAPSFISKLLSEYGDDSIAELANEVIGVEGVSLLGSYHLTDQRIGISFLEKSTRYLPFESNFYIPDKLYEYGLVDDFKDLCGLSYNTFNKIRSELNQTFREEYPIHKCYFPSSTGYEILFGDIKGEQNMKVAQMAYNSSINAKVYDTAGYSWLTALKTNIGLNSNARALESLIIRTKTSNLSELRNLSQNLYGMLQPRIEPFIIRTQKVEPLPINPFQIYSKDETSPISLYKYYIATSLRARDNSDINGSDKTFMERRGYEEDNEKEEEEGEREEEEHMMIQLGPNKPIQSVVIKSIIGNSMPYKIKYNESNINTVHINESYFEPNAKLIQFTDEQTAVDTITSAIVYEHDERLLEYDDQEIMNIDPALRITKIDESKIEQGMLYHIINNHKTLEEMFKTDYKINKSSENTVTFENIQEYWQENRDVNDMPIHHDYGDPKAFTLTKDQQFLFNKYIGERKSRRDKLGRAFEFVDYMFELSSSFRILREFKRHRTLSPIYPKVITARDSYDSFIFPMSIVQNRDLFDLYKNLIDKSFKLYKKIAKKDYITAQYCLPISVRCNYVIKANLRELDHLLSLRTTPQAHPEFRTLAQCIYHLLYTVHPNLAKILTFVDSNYYPLGRIKSEYNKEKKKIALEK